MTFLHHQNLPFPTATIPFSDHEMGTTFTKLQLLVPQAVLLESAPRQTYVSVAAAHVAET